MDKKITGDSLKITKNKIYLCNMYLENIRADLVNRLN